MTVVRVLLITWITTQLAQTASPAYAIPAEYQRCKIGNTCTIGEFYYTDDVTPIAGASCSLTTRNPSNTVIISGGAMTDNGGGWYSYGIDTTGFTEGIYPSQMCCTYSGETICIDKTFRATNADLTAQEVEDAVLDANLADHNTAGSVGEQLSNTPQDSADALLNANLGDYTNAGSVGEQLNNSSTLTSGDVETAVWSSSSRTLTGFGSLIQDIWSYSSRSLTTFGSLVTSIWTNPTRTLSENPEVSLSDDDITNIANEVNTTIDGTVEQIVQDNTTNLTSNDVQNALSTVLENSQTLSDIQTDVNSIENFLTQITQNTTTNTINFNQTSTGGESLAAQIEQTRSTLNQLFASLEQTLSQVGLTILSWDTLSSTDLQNQLTLIAQNLGTDPTHNEYESSILSLANWLNNTWNNDLTNQLLLDVQAATNLVDTITNHTNLTSSDLTNLSTVLTALESASGATGNVSSAESSDTLFGMLKRLERLASTLSSADQQLTDLLNSWDQYSTSEIEQKLSTTEASILEVNILPNASEIISTNGDTTQDKLKNLTLSLKALITGNQLALGGNGLDPINLVWLESGTNTVIFRSFTYNPSSASQIIPLTFNLPKELTDQDIIELPEGLEANYDQTSELYTIGGQLSHEAGDLQTQSTITRDFWHLSPEEVQSLKQQAADLLSGLEGTNYYTEAASLKSQIDVTLDQILESQNKAVTPDDRIAYYRSAQTRLNEVKGNIGRLKSLVDEAANSGSLMGFIGGVQAISLWGLIVIIIAGFIFLTAYMRLLYKKELGLHHPNQTGESTDAIPQPPTTSTVPFLNIGDKKPPFKKPQISDPSQRLFQILVIILSTSIVVVLIVGTVLETTKDSQTLSAASQSQTQPQ